MNVCKRESVRDANSPRTNIHCGRVAVCVFFRVVALYNVCMYVCMYVCICICMCMCMCLCK